MALPLIFAAIFVTSAALSYAVTKQAQKKAEKAAQDAMGVLINRSGLTEQIPVVYGTRRVGGVRVFATTGEGASADLPNDELYMAIVVAEGEVESITDLHVDGVPYIGSKYVNWLQWWAYTGTDTQAASSFLISNSDGKWTADHKLSGLAYIVVKLRMTEIQRKNVWSGLPELTVLVKGRKVYDPRTATTAWSDNPALCIRDYLTNPRYGKGVSESSIDDTLFSQAANTLDQTYVLVDGEPADKPYRCNAVMDADSQLIDNTRDLLLGCKGFLPYSNGKYGLVLDQGGSSTFAFTPDKIISGIEVEGLDKSAKYNQVVVTFPNAVSDYQSDEVVYPVVDSAEDQAWLAEDYNERLKEEITISTITSRSAAYNIAKTILVRSRNNLRVSFAATSEALNLTVGDICDITHPSLGWSAKPFKIESIALNNDGTCAISAREYVSEAYQFGSIAVDPAYPQASLPDPLLVRAPTGLQATESSVIASDGSLLLSLAVEWIESTDGFLSGYELQWKKSTDTEYNSVLVVSTHYLITGVEANVNYNIQVRALNGFGSSSDFLPIVTGALAGDSTAPGVPTSVAAAAGQGAISISWVNPADKDFSNAIVYRSDTSGGTFLPIATVGGGYGQPASFANGALGDSNQYYYKVSAVDYSGNESALSAEVTATTNPPAQTPRTSKGYVYYTIASPTAPATPSASSYNYDTGVLTGLTSGWQQDPIEIDGSDGKFWAASYVVIESEYGGSQTLTFSSPFASYSFDGLVTFTNLNNELADPNSTEITTIDGGLVKTGTIDVGLVNIAGTSSTGLNVKSAASGSRMELTSSTIKIYEGSTLRVKIGNLA